MTIDLFNQIANEINKNNSLEQDWNINKTYIGTNRMWINATIHAIEKELNKLHELIDEPDVYADDFSENIFNKTAFPIIGKPKDNLINELIVVLYKKFTSYQASGVYCTKSKGYQAGWHDAFELVKQILENELEE